MKEIKKFELTDYYDILNLYKALLEAKFNENPDNTYVAGSPIIARFINELVDSLSDYEDNENKSWKKWRRLKNHNYYRKRAINHIIEFDFSDWLKYSMEQKKERLPNYLSPFTHTEEELLETINEIDLTIEQLKNDNYYRKKAINHIVEFDFSYWIECNNMEEKKKELLIHLRPFTYTEEELLETINEIDFIIEQKLDKK